MYNIAFYEEMKEHNVNVLAIPPHTSHLVQALDSTPFEQFKSAWQSKLLDWLFNTGAKNLSKKNFFDAFWPAFHKSITVAKNQSGFHCTGIFPVNFNATDKARFVPVQVTDSKDS